MVLILRNGFEFNVTQEELGLLIGGLIFTAIWIVSANLCVIKTDCSFRSNASCVESKKNQQKNTSIFLIQREKKSL